MDPPLLQVAGAWRPAAQYRAPIIAGPGPAGKSGPGRVGWKDRERPHSRGGRLG